MIGAAHQQAVVTLVERKSGYAVLAKVKKKTSDLVSSTILTKLKPLAPLVKTITFDNVLNTSTFSSDRQSHPATAIGSKKIKPTTTSLHPNGHFHSFFGGLD